MRDSMMVLEKVIIIMVLDMLKIGISVVDDFGWMPYDYSAAMSVVTNILINIANIASR
jgi:hypothetical protein